jgi:hypothetical protein
MVTEKLIARLPKKLILAVSTSAFLVSRYRKRQPKLVANSVKPSIILLFGSW